MIVFNNKEHGARIAKAIPRVYNPADNVISRVEGPTPDGKLLGGVIYDGHTGPLIFMHQAGFTKRWISRELLWVCFDYPFNQLGCTKVAGTIPSTDQALLDINLKMGFVVETSLEGGYPGGDMLVMTMTRDQCRWLKLKPRELAAA